MLLFMCTRKRGDIVVRMGRPTDNPKDNIIKIRATKEDREKLLYCCQTLNKTQYDVVMEGINKVYESIK
jgi:hypothetical protein